MTRQHFELLATVIEENTNEQGIIDRNILASRLAEVLAQTNPNFNRDRFLVACGVEI